MTSGIWRNTDQPEKPGCAGQTVRYDELFRQGLSLLREAEKKDGGTFEDAGLDVRLLLEEVCHTTLQTLLVHPETPVDEDRQKLFLELVHRRSAHEPLAQILGFWYFCGLKFLVTKDVLIPEQDSEILVETALDELTGSSEPLHILDLCTGSGCLAIALLELMRQKKCAVIGTCTCTDLSEKALEVARKNASALIPGSGEEDVNISFFQGDLFSPVSGRQFNVLISNPPYIATREIEQLAPEVKLGEPRAALDGGPDGLVFYRRIAAECGSCLNDGARVFLEIGWDQGQAVTQILTLAGFRNIRTVKDYGGNDRVICAVFDKVKWQRAGICQPQHGVGDAAI